MKNTRYQQGIKVNNNLLRIATRKSPLALWQAHFISAQLQSLYPHLTIEIIGMTTQGDRILNTQLAKVGGKGLFTKELEEALLSNKADIAVHSMKDVTIKLPTGFGIAAICQREDCEDAFIACKPLSFNTLASQSKIGTASLRRQAQILALRNDLKVEPLRGNITTRLKKLESGEFDALILAAAGIKRLGLAHYIQSTFSTNVFLPAIGQGALGIECLTANTTIWDMVAALDHLPTRLCVTAERAINQRLGGSCSTPIAGYAVIENNLLYVQGLVASPDGKILLKASQRGNLQNATKLGHQVAEDLLAKGAGAILSAFN